MSGIAKGRTIFRKYVESDKPQLLRLYETVWGEEKANKIASIWEWKYHTNPFRQNSEHPSLVAEKDNTIVGFLGAFPARLKIGLKIHEGLWLGDFMVDPKHRGMVGYRLTRMMIDTQPVLIGHADSGNDENAIAYRVWQRTKCKPSRGKKIEVTIIASMIKRVSIRDAAFRKIRIRPLAILADRVWRFAVGLRYGYPPEFSRPTVEVIEISRFLKEHGPFLDELMKENGNIPLKTPEYLNWRFFERPGATCTVLLALREKKIVGYIAFRCVNEEGKINGRIVDLLVKRGEKDGLRALLKTAEATLRNKGSRLVRIYGSNEHYVQKELERTGFSNKKSKEPIVIVIGQCPDDNFFNEHEWHISLSDGDFEMN